jgi:Holliday junction resolvase
MVNKNYIKGRNREYKAMKILEDGGYYCSRSAGSHGMWDIIAFNKNGFRLIQVKCDCAPTALELEEIKNFKDIPDNTTKELWTFYTRKSKPLITKF